MRVRRQILLRILNESKRFKPRFSGVFRGYKMIVFIRENKVQRGILMILGGMKVN